MARALVSIVLMLCGFVTHAAADTYPSGPVTLIMPYAAGGGVDIVSRLIAESLQRKLGQPFIVNIRGGAASQIGTQYVAKSRPDGYTLLVYSGSFLTNPSTQKELPYDSVKDFAPVATVGESSQVLLVSTKLGVNTLQEYIALAKAHPDKLTYASSGIGSILHLSGELLQDETGIKIRHVPYKGTGAIFPDLISGVVDSTIIGSASGIPFVKSGQLKALAVTAPKRIPSLPDVPTFTELGVALTVLTPYGVIAPAGTPPEVIARLSKAISEVLDSKELRERFAREEIQPSFSTPEQTGQYIRTEIDRFGALVKKVGIEPQ